ncbi:Nn.00g075770.m01.CDS01 [Neocucurbitaria sp. VM-36]
MDSTLRSSTFFFGSETSSVYSDDDLISEANSTGTQIHHKSTLKPTIGGVTREYGQNFERPSTLSLWQGDLPQESDDTKPSNLYSSQGQSVPYRFESPEEALERFQSKGARAGVSVHKTSRDTDSLADRERMHRALSESDVLVTNKQTLDGQSFDYDDYATKNDSDLLVRHRSVPSRRRPSITSTGTYAVRDIRNKAMSADASTLFPPTDARKLAMDYIRETCRSGTSFPEEERFEPTVEAAQPLNPWIRALSISREPSELDLADHELPAVERQNHHFEALQALSRGTPGAAGHEQSANLRHSRIRASSETWNANRRQGRVDWRDGVTNGPPLRVSFYSTAGREYSLGDPSRGYSSGEYITDIEGVAPAVEETRKKNFLKRLFCLR